MINEILLVENLLDGKCIDKQCLFQHCFLIAKYYLQQGKEAKEVRKLIFDWATKYRIHLDIEELNVNRLIYKAMNDKRRLREDVSIKISHNDIKEITSRFDSKKTRKVALAILCYAKAAADRDNCFNLSVTALCSWIHVDYSHTLSKTLHELSLFEYIDYNTNKQNQKTYTWGRMTRSKSSKFKLLVPIYNGGAYQLIDNDIDALFNECFP